MTGAFQAQFIQPLAGQNLALGQVFKPKLVVGGGSSQVPGLLTHTGESTLALSGLKACLDALTKRLHSALQGAVSLQDVLGRS